MPKTVSRTIRDIVVADMVAVTISGPLDDPAQLRITAVAKLFDDASGDEIDELSFTVEDLPPGQSVALSNILKNDVVDAANAALQARGDSDVVIPPA